MQKIIICLYVMLTVVGLALTPARAAAPVALAADLSLEKLSEDKKEAAADLGGGVSVQIFQGKFPMQQNLVVLDRGQKLEELEGGKFIQAISFESGPRRYWVISAYTGGAHCCGVYYIFCRPVRGQPLRNLGKTPGHNGSPLKLKGLVLFEQGEIYFADLDNRFDYFHESHAGSLLVNFPYVFYRLGSDAMQLDDGPFKAGYLKAAARVDGEIAKEAASRRDQPEAILTPGFGSGYEGLHFSDHLGQLLIKRTVLQIYARENDRAWQSLEMGVEKYYRTTRWLPELRREIQKKMSEAPY